MYTPASRWKFHSHRMRTSSCWESTHRHGVEWPTRHQDDESALNVGRKSARYPIRVSDPFRIFIETLHREQEMWSEGLRASLSRKLRGPQFHRSPQPAANWLTLSSQDYCSLVICVQEKKLLQHLLWLPWITVYAQATVRKLTLTLSRGGSNRAQILSQHFNANICNLCSLHLQYSLVTLVLMHF